jgi:hypothetical protein
MRQLTGLCLFVGLLGSACSGGGGGGGGGGGPTPIAQQSCAQLAQTLVPIQQGLEPGVPASEQARATQEMKQLNARLDELSGCPSEPSLQAARA